MQARLTIDELHQIKWLIGVVLTLLSLWALSSLDLIGSGLSFILVAGISIAFLKPGWVHSIPKSFWSRFAVPLILVLVLVDFGLGFTSLVAPLMRMVILLLIYRTLAPRNRREDLQMLLLSLFSIIVSGALTVSLLFAVQILLFAPLAMTFLLVVCLLDRGSESANYRPGWGQFSFKRLVWRISRAIDIRAFALGSLLFVFVVAVSTGFFILIPRFDLGQTIPFMQMDTKPRTGFSDTISLNSVSEIVEDQSIALRIDLPDLAAIGSLPYWRILVLDRYRNGQFSLSDKASNLRRYSKLREFSGRTRGQIPPEFRTGEQWTFYFEGGVSQYLPLPTLFQTIRFTKEQAVELLPDLHVVSLGAVQKSTFSYQLDNPLWNVRVSASALENETFGRKKNDDRTESNATTTYPLTTLSLILDENERALLANLNGRLIGKAANLNVVEYSERITSYLRENYRYSLNPDGIQGSGDPIVSWIENGTVGHCELYAGSFVLLARDAGYPARMVVGFSGGSWNAVENFFVVRNSDAHAWAEIYDADAEEWLRVDPTPGNSRSVDPEVVSPVNFELETGMLAWVDSLRMQWYRRVISFDQDDQIALATSLMDVGDSLLDSLSKRSKELLARLKDWLSKPFSYENSLRLAIALGVCFGLYYLWRTLIRSDLFSRFAGKSDSLSSVRKQASHYMNKVRTEITERGIDGAHVETLQNLYVQLEALRFGPKVSSQLALPIFKKTRRVLRK